MEGSEAGRPGRGAPEAKATLKVSRFIAWSDSEVAPDKPLGQRHGLLAHFLRPPQDIFKNPKANTDHLPPHPNMDRRALAQRVKLGEGREKELLGKQPRKKKIQLLK